MIPAFEGASVWLRRCLRIIVGVGIGANPGSGFANTAALLPDDVSPFHRYQYRNWSTESGLPQISANALLRDQQGYLWVSTEKGAARFDGTTFENFAELLREILGTRWTTALHQTPDAQIWIGSAKGLGRYTDGTIVAVPLGNTGAEHVHAIAGLAGQVCAAANALYCGTVAEGLSPVDDWRGAAHSLLPSAGGLWVGGVGAVAFYDGRRLLQQPPLPGAAGQQAVLAMAAYQGDLWVGTSTGLYRLQAGRWREIAVDASSGRISVTALAVDARGVLWVATRDAVHRFLGSRYLESIPNEGPTGFGWVVSLLADERGGMWMGSQQSGLRYAWHAGAERLNADDGLTNLALWSYWADEDQLLTGTNDGVFEFRQGRFHHLIPGSELPDPRAYSVLRTRQGHIFVGTRAGLYQMTADGKFLRSFPALRNLQINGLLEEPGIGLWIASSDGLFLHHDGGLQRIGQTRGLSESQIRFVLRGREGRLWVGTQKGLFVASGDEFHRVPKSGPEQDFVTAMLELSDGRLLVGTYGGLIHVRDPELGWWQLSSAHGLPSESIFFLGQHQDTVMASFAEGVLRIPLPHIQPDSQWNGSGVELLLVHPGIYPNRSTLRCCNGAGIGKGVIWGDYAWFPSLGGAVRVPLRQPVRSAPRVTVQSLIQRDSSIRIQSRVDLPTGERDLEIGYSAIDFKDALRLRYRYRLNGFEQRWTEAEKRRTAYFTNLPPGQFQFEVQAKRQWEAWGPTNTFDLLVPKLVYETWAFRAAVLALLMVLAGWFFRWRLNVVNARNAAVVNELQRLDALKDQFLANTSHELRTPLHGIIGLAESMVEGGAESISDAVRRNVAMMGASARRLARLVDDLLDFSRLKSHDLRISPRPLDLRVAVEVATMSLGPLFKERGLECMNTIDTDMPPVLADEERLQQVLTNLLGNAIKFTDEGSVTVSAEAARDEVRIRVTDTGIGIAAEEQARIFSAFEQVDGDATRARGGTGIGLAVTRQLVELQGGRIEVESALGQGSTFTVVLPRAEDLPESRESGRVSGQFVQTLAQNPDIEQTPVEQPNAHHDHIQVLVVDDEAVNQQVLSNHLRPRNFDIILASSGTEALEKLESHPNIALVLLDIMMPRMSGYEVCERIRETRLPSELPVIMVTAKNQIRDLVTGLAVGANDYVAKPFARQELIARINTHLNLLKINSAYGSFVPHDFLRHLGQDSIVDVRLGDNVELDIAIFISDIRGFTSLSETMSPSENFDFINAYFERTGPVIRDQGGFISRYTGDSIMALFPHSADDALRAARATLEQLASWNVDRVADGHQPIDIGIGLHAGPMRLGVVGEALRRQGDVFSDTINLASRIESLTKHYGCRVIASAQFMRRLSAPLAQADQRHLARVTVRGRGEAVDLFEFIDTSAQAEDLGETLDDYAAGMAGLLDGDLDAARKCFRRVLEKNPGDKAARVQLQEIEQAD